jgi:hypothetical protein
MKKHEAFYNMWLEQVGAGRSRILRDGEEIVFTREKIQGRRRVSCQLLTDITMNSATPLQVR